MYFLSPYRVSKGQPGCCMEVGLMVDTCAEETVSTQSIDSELKKYSRVPGPIERG